MPRERVNVHTAIAENLSAAIVRQTRQRKQNTQFLWNCNSPALCQTSRAICFEEQMNATENETFTPADRFVLSKNNQDLWMREIQKGVRTSIREVGDRLEVVIPVAEDARAEDLHDAVTFALAWRDRLIKYQGCFPTKADRFLSILDDAHTKSKRRASYATLANFVNENTADVLKSFIAFGGPEPIRGKDGDEWVKAWRKWIEAEPVKNYFEAMDKLKTLRVDVNKDAVKQVLDEGIERIKKGLPPFDKGYPVDASKVRETLKYWRKERKPKLIRFLTEEERDEAEPSYFLPSQIPITDTPFTLRKKRWWQYP